MKKTITFAPLLTTLSNMDIEQHGKVGDNRYQSIDGTERDHLSSVRRRNN